MIARIIRFFGLSMSAMALSFVGVLGVYFDNRNHEEIAATGWIVGFAVMAYLIFARHWRQGRAALVGVLGCGFIGEALQKGGAEWVGGFVTVMFGVGVLVWWIKSNHKHAKGYIKGGDQKQEGR